MAIPLLGFILPQQQPNRRNFSNVATHLARRATRKGIFCRIIFCTQGQGIKNAAARPQRRALWCLASRRDDCAAHCAAVSSGLARAGGLGNGVGARTLLRQGQACKAGLRQPRQLRHGECFFIAPEPFLDSFCDRRVTADRGRAYAGLRTRLPLPARSNKGDSRGIKSSPAAKPEPFGTLQAWHAKHAFLGDSAGSGRQARPTRITPEAAWSSNGVSGQDGRFGWSEKRGVVLIAPVRLTNAAAREGKGSGGDNAGAPVGSAPFAFYMSATSFCLLPARATKKRTCFPKTYLPGAGRLCNAARGTIGERTFRLRPVGLTEACVGSREGISK